MRRILAAGALGALALAACTQRQPQTWTIPVDDLAFGPSPQGLHVGDTVVWTNHDLFQHSATAQGVFDVELPAGGSGRTLLKQPGLIVYICRYHPGMTARLEVKP